jgi:hypothetical protein
LKGSMTTRLRYCSRWAVAVEAFFNIQHVGNHLPLVPLY